MRKLSTLNRLTASIVLWTVIAFLGSMLYYKLKEWGIIFDNPDQILVWRNDYTTHAAYQEWINNCTFNGRKVIFAFSTALLMVIFIMRLVETCTGKDIFPGNENKNK